MVIRIPQSIVVTVIRQPPHFLLIGPVLHSLIAQTKSQITSAVDNGSRVTLPGNIHPLIQHALDLGAADTSASTGRMILVLKSSSESQAELQQYLQDAHVQGSPSYHKWLTPAEFGERFGAASSDIAQVQVWLESQGLAVTRTPPGRLGIEFTGTVGQVGSAFRTSIHSFQVNGETHRANISNPQIPAAFANVVRGVSSLNDFRLHTTSHSLGKASLNRQTHQARQSGQQVTAVKLHTCYLRAISPTSTTSIPPTAVELPARDRSSASSTIRMWTPGSSMPIAPSSDFLPIRLKS